MEKTESSRPAASEKKSAAGRKPQYSPIIISESGGVRYLHFGTEWIQGAMRLRDPDRVELAYGRQMMAWTLFIENPAHIVQLGLGSGSLVRFCYRHFPLAKVTAVELNPEVIAVCRSMFFLPPDDARLAVLEMDAMDYVEDRKNHGKADILHADLYDATARGPVLDSSGFYAACASCLTERGIMAVNLFGAHRSYGKNLQNIRKAFPFVLSMPECEEGNVVVLAFRKTPEWHFAELTVRARQIREDTGIAALKWVRELRQAIKNSPDAG